MKIVEQKFGWTIVVDTLQDPGNLGTIIRIADWFGINEVILSKNSVELFNPKVIQATMGSFTRVNVIYEDIIKWLLSQDRTSYGAVLGGKNLYSTTFPQSGILILGNESKGISDELLTVIDHQIEIPKRGGAESLNVSMACSIFSNEIMRQSFQQ
jgi:TrmH family RNA methyltransferase